MSESIVPPEDTYLATGWEPDLPAEDTLVRQAVLVHASWAAEVARRAGRPWRSEPRWVGGWIGDRGEMTNWVVPVQPLTDPAAVLDDVHSLFPAHVPYALVSAWPTDDLRPHGLVLIGHPPLMVRFPGPGRSATPRDVEVREVHDTDGLALAERVLVEGYPMPHVQPLRTGDVLGVTLLEGPTRVWLAWVDGEPVAVAAAHLHAGVTLVEYVATLRQARGRGAGAAVTWAATMADPDRSAVLIASDDGRPVYERLGFRALERWTVWLRPAR